MRRGVHIIYIDDLSDKLLPNIHQTSSYLLTNQAKSLMPNVNTDDEISIAFKS